MWSRYHLMMIVRVVSSSSSGDTSVAGRNYVLWMTSSNVLRHNGSRILLGAPSSTCEVRASVVLGCGILMFSIAPCRHIRLRWIASLIIETHRSSLWARASTYHCLEVLRALHRNLSLRLMVCLSWSHIRCLRCIQAILSLPILLLNCVPTSRMFNTILRLWILLSRLSRVMPWSVLITWLLSVPCIC